MLAGGWARELDLPGDEWHELARRVQGSFNRRFVYLAGGYLYDLVDGQGPEPNDSSLRPNQILALALAHPVLDEEHWPAVLAAVERALLTPVGLRTLAPEAPGYRGRYAGDRVGRDEAYHQGTVWPWLLGPLVDAWLRLRGDRAGRRRRPRRASFHPRRINDGGQQYAASRQAGELGV
jgi:predicted glycogen debranching enzyme